jgi:hypothetical protein
MEELIDGTVDRFMEAIEMCPEGMREIITARLLSKLAPPAKLNQKKTVITLTEVSATDPHKECRVHMYLLGDPDIAMRFRQIIDMVYDKMFSGLIERMRDEYEVAEAQLQHLSLEEQFEFLCRSPSPAGREVPADDDNEWRSEQTTHFLYYQLCKQSCLAIIREGNDVDWWRENVTTGHRSLIPVLSEAYERKDYKREIDMYHGDGVLVATEFETSYDYHWYMDIKTTDDNDAVDLTIHEH